MTPSTNSSNLEQQMDRLSVIQALPVTPAKEKELLLGKTSAEAAGGHQESSSGLRCTRSQAAPHWTTYESLVLVNEIAAMDEDWLKALSSYQRWKMISDNCVASDVVRTSSQCKRRWEALYAGFRKIREWESGSGEGSYWSLDGKKKQQLGLPAVFEQEVFSSMDAVIKTLEDRAGPADIDAENLIGADGVSEDLPVTRDAEMPVVDDAQGCKNNADDKTHDREKARAIASKLQENAQQIHAILRGELEDDLGFDPAQVDLANPSDLEIEFTRCQADELIKALRGLVDPLNQFAELIRTGNHEGFKPID